MSGNHQSYYNFSLMFKMCKANVSKSPLLDHLRLRGSPLTTLHNLEITVGTLFGNTDYGQEVVWGLLIGCRVSCVSLSCSLPLNLSLGLQTIISYGLRLSIVLLCCRSLKPNATQTGLCRRDGE